MSTTLYTRTTSPNGRHRYEPWGEAWWDHREQPMPFGSYSVVVKAGCVSIIKVEPEFAAAEAALLDCRDAMCAAVLARNTSSPRLLTEQERKAWAAYKAVMGPEWDGHLVYEGVSPMDLVEAALAVLRERMAEQAGETT